METLKNPNINFPVISAFGAVIFTVMLLIILSNLSKIYIPPGENIDPSPEVIFDNRELLRPLEPVTVVPEQTPIPQMKPDERRNRAEPPEKFAPRLEFISDGPGTGSSSLLGLMKNFQFLMLLRFLHLFRLISSR